MKAAPLEAAALESPATVPAPEFTVIDAAPVPFAAGPTMAFSLNAVEPEGHDIYTIALSAQIQIDPARRTYDEATRARLGELFGEPGRWGATTHSFLWARVETLVPSFVGARAFELRIPCTYDLEVASAKYFHGITDGDVPLSFHFNGTVFYRRGDGELQLGQIAWSTSAQFGMPISVWRAMIDEHYPNGGWVRLDKLTLERLHARRAERGLASFDACVAELLDDA